ncbi:hypothetical protein CDEST_07938 [Colletotrichum destructivum]|uniref:Uncharacterized protein n=1 Tax=Colletotrichum destructivum TaxID=34406 RepID=A0AAX4IHU5_9PEZI|nr:hypothetical protein CDEST_07938 [Colletotrichum destructivum]
MSRFNIGRAGIAVSVLADTGRTGLFQHSKDDTANGDGAVFGPGLYGPWMLMGAKRPTGRYRLF